MNDRISVYRVARLSLFPPMTSGEIARYAIIANTLRKGVPSGQILADGVLRGVAPFPTTEEVLEAMDAALRQHMLH
jgi:hypothetical protein